MKKTIAGHQDISALEMLGKPYSLAYKFTPSETSETCTKDLAIFI